MEVTIVTMSKIKLTYFDIEGAAEKVRLALVLTGTEFHDERISFDDWSELKPKTKFGQVPMMKMPDGKEVAQSAAMLRWVGRSYDSVLGGSLYPQDIPSMFAIDETLGLVDDFKQSFMPCMYMIMRPQAFGYPADIDGATKGKIINKLTETWKAEKLPDFMKFFEENLEASGSFLCGDKPTIADCELIPILRAFTQGKYAESHDLPATLLDAYPLITTYIQRFMNIPAVAKWYGTTHA